MDWIHVIRFLIFGKSYSFSFLRVLESRLENIFSGKFISLASMREGFFHVLSILKNRGNKRILIPECIFYPLFLIVRELGYDYQIYSLDENLEIDIKDVTERISEFSPDIVLLAQHYGNYDPFSEPLKKICQDKDIILLEDMAHGLAHMKTSGDLVFFSFGTGKDVTGFGGGAVCVHDKYIDILTVLKEKSSVYKDDDLKKSLITVLPEVIFSTTPVYEFFIFPYLYLVSLLKRSVVDDILTGRDEYISRDLKTMHPFQAYMILNQLKGFEKRMKRRKRIGRYISRHLPLLPNSTYLCAACRTDRKQTEKILESLMKNGIDCRRDYMDFLQEHPLKDCLIYIPTHHQMNIRHIRRIIRLLKRGEKPKI